MKIPRFLLSLVAIAAAALAPAQTFPTGPVTVTTTSDGTLRTPTTLWTANAGAIGASVSSTVTPPWSAITGKPTTLSGYGITDAQPLDSDLSAIAILSTTSFGRSCLTVSDAAALRAQAGVVIGTDVQAYDADLASYAAAADASARRDLLGATAGVFPRAFVAASAISEVTGLQAALDAKLDDSQASAAGLSILGAASAAAQRTALGLVIGTDVLAPAGSGAALTGITGTQVANTPAGTVAATTVQGALNELDTEKASLVRAEARSDIGEFFRVDGAAALADHWSTANAGAKFALNSYGQITGSGGSGTFGDRLTSLISVADETMEASVDVVFDGARDSTSYGISVGLEQANSWYGRTWHAQLDASTSGTAGILRLWLASTPGTTGTVVASDATAYTVAQNSLHRLTLGRAGARVYARVENLGTGQRKYVYVTGNLAASKNYPIPVTSHITITQHGGDHTILSVGATSRADASPHFVALGDSKVVGYAATIIGARWADLVAQSMGARHAVFAGDGDRTAECLAQVQTLVRHCRPRYAILCVGRNDLASGVSSATWQANYQAIVSALEGAGVRVIHMLPIPEVGLDQSALKTWIQATYAGSPTVDPSVGWVDATDVSADNIHPTPAGHTKIADAVLSAGVL